jgi:flavin-dependent dehydrogenase
MDRSDVLVVGGGPAGSTCARRLVAAGLDVTVIDKAVFPRDKVCAGWITPAVVRALDLDLTAYAAEATLQPFTGFRTGALGQSSPITTDYGQPISYGIRRCEFDHYLLRRSGARVLTGQPVRHLRRDTDGWIVNGTLRSRLIVGAGGHFCPTVRVLNPVETSGEPREAVVVAQETEQPVDDGSQVRDRVSPECPELFFWPDLTGYGWCVRKGRHLNVGVGRLTQAGFPAAVAEFKSLLRARRLVPDHVLDAWKGHAYLLNITSRRRLSGDRMLLAGDAAGLALAPSGEGILAAVESGLLAAEAILDSTADWSSEGWPRYEAAIEARFGPRGRTSPLSRVPGWLAALGGRAMLRSSRLTRRFLLEEGFLHSRRPALEIRAPG